MRKWILGLLAGTALVTVGGGAFAQDEVKTPWAVRIGALWPTDKAVRNATDNTWFSAGLDYTINTQDTNEWVGAVDYASGKNVNAWILQLLYKWHNGDEGSATGNFSFGVGGGVYFFDPDAGGRQTEWGIPLVADWDFNRNIFLEGKYHWVISDSDVNNLTLQLGYRF